jgi:hypothetical protein
MSRANTNSQGNSPSRKNSTPSQNPHWSEPGNPFHCSAEWHLQELNSRLTPTLYFWARRLSSKSDCFFPSVESIAGYFCRNRTTVFRALQELVQCGWAEIVRREPGKAVVYRLLDHDDWAKMHPDLCIEKDVMPWEGQGDSLGAALYAASGGRAKFLPRQMNGLRKSGFADDEIVLEFRVFLSRTPQTGGEWKGVYYRFRTHLFLVANDLRRGAAVTKNSGSKESHGRDPYPSHACNPTCRTDATGTRRTGATQVFELRVEREVDGKRTIPALRSQERPSASPTNTKLHGRGFPPSKPSPRTVAGEVEKPLPAVPTLTSALYEDRHKLLQEQKVLLLKKYGVPTARRIQ